jgi:branched-chain amino acid transport system ATP-binding protein
MADLDVDHINLAFRGLKVLDDFSMSLEPGELLALIGPNGAGKTSVFNCISGLYVPQGRITFRGKNLVGRKPHYIANLGVARTFQHGELFQHMTVMENVLTGRHGKIATSLIGEMAFLPGFRREEERHRAFCMDILRFLEVERLAERPVVSLPFGMQKIIGLARALAPEPALVLLDEPSAGLNGEEREDLAYFIMKVRERLKIALIWIEHDMQMVSDLADRIHVLDYGRTLAVGPPETVLANEQVIQAYLGRRAIMSAVDFPDSSARES